MSPRVTFKDSPDQLEVRIRAARPESMRTILIFEASVFAFFLLIGWIVSSHTDVRWFWRLWIGIIAAGFLVSVALWAWWLFGVEVIQVTQESLRRKLQIAGLGDWRSYDLDSVSDLRAAGPFQDYWPVEWVRDEDGFGFDIGSPERAIAFEHRRSTHRIGTGLSERDATGVVERLNSRLGESTSASPQMDG